MLKDKLGQIQRITVLVLSLMWIVYIVLTLRVAPVEKSFEIVWSPDVALTVASVANESPLNGILMENDILLAIDGVDIRRGFPVFPTIKQEYDFTIQRGEQVLTILVPLPISQVQIGSFDFVLICFVVILWLTAVIMFTLGIKQIDSSRIGYLFLGFGIWFLGFRGALVGLPFSVLIGHSLGFVVAVGFLYTGITFGDTPTEKIKRLFRWLFSISFLFAGIAILEVLFLFPQSQSIQQFTNISWIQLQLFIGALGLIGHIISLITRYLQADQQTYLKKQLGMLLFFIIIGSTPSIIIAIIPNEMFFGNPSVFILSIALLSLITKIADCIDIKIFE